MAERQNIFVVIGGEPDSVPKTKIAFSRINARKTVGDKRSLEDLVGPVAHFQFHKSCHVGHTAKKRPIRYFVAAPAPQFGSWRSEDHTSELQSHSFISYA